MEKISLATITYFVNRYSGDILSANFGWSLQRTNHLTISRYAMNVFSLWLFHRCGYEMAYERRLVLANGY